MGWFSNSKVGGTSAVATAEAPKKTEAQVPAVTTAAPASTNAEAVQTLNANPASLKVSDLEIVSKENSEKLGDEAKAILKRFVGEDPTNVALASKDGNLLLPLSNPTTSRNESFKKGFFFKIKSVFGFGAGRDFALQWLKQVDRANPSLITPETNDVLKAIGNGEVSTMPIFMKGPDGKFGTEPEAVLLIDNASEISQTVKDHDKLGPLAKECEKAEESSNHRVAIIEGVIFNPNGKSKLTTPDEFTKLLPNVSEAIFMAQTQLAKQDTEKKFKPATALLFPMAVNATREGGESTNLRFHTINNWQHVGHKSDGTPARNSEIDDKAEKVMTIVTPKTVKTLETKFTPLLAAWSQLGLSSKLPEDKILHDLAIKLPNENAQLLEAYNAKLAPKPAPITTASEKPTALAA